jgi:uracil-DNA glycosylase
LNRLSQEFLKNWLKWQNSVQPILVEEESIVFKDLLRENKTLLTASVKNLKGEVHEIADLGSLHRSISSCQKCRLGETRNNLVFGEGSENSELMFIGEGPGHDEDITGRPFVGKAGMLLTKIIENGLKIQRGSVYIANIVKCRPPGNRDPLPDEAETCIDYLRKQIGFIKPSVIVLLGRVAAKHLLDIEESITKAREKIYYYEGIPVFVTYHPSALLRNEKYKRPVWEDIKKVIAYLDRINGRISP